MDRHPWLLIGNHDSQRFTEQAASGLRHDRFRRHINRFSVGRAVVSIVGAAQPGRMSAFRQTDHRGPFLPNLVQ